MSKSKDINVKIIIACHKQSQVPDGDIFLPVQVGSAIANVDLGIQRDDEGNNISNKNRRYCELTAVYWAWKNLDADYYGLWHYRRYMSFNDDLNVAENPYGEYELQDNDKDTLKRLGLSDIAAVKNDIAKYDFLVPNQGSAGSGGSTYDHYASHHYIKDLDFCLECVRREYPAIAKYIDVSMADDYGYLRNMFIMKKDIFDDYCRFIFGVLKKFDKAVDVSDYDVVQYRVDGYLAERLTDIYLHYLMGEKTSLKYKELKSVYFWHTDPQVELMPANKENNIPIVLAINNNYVPYVSVMLHSIAAHMSQTSNYDIVIFNKDISSDNKQQLLNEFANFSNLSIRFYDITRYLNVYKKMNVRGHWSIETYFRLFIPEVMTNYKKVIYLDADMVVLDDLAKLYSIDINDYLMGVTRDPDSAGLYNGAHPGAEISFDNHSQLNWHKRKYVDSALKLDRPYDYFQAGVLLMNLKKMRQQLDVPEVVKLAISRQWELQDQDVLNVVCKDKVKFIDLSWNVEFNWKHKRLNNVIKLAPKWLYDEYLAARKCPMIVHYAAPDKPWHNPACDFGLEWWQCARKSIYYEVIVARMSEHESKRQVELGEEYMEFKRKIRPRIGRAVRKIAPKGTRRRDILVQLKHAIKRG